METRSERTQPPVLAAHGLVAVNDLAMRLGARPQADGPTVTLRQRGRMRQDVDSDWMVFNARQTISTATARFDWRAQTGLLGTVMARASYRQGHGGTGVRLLGLVPISPNIDSTALSRGELIRYLAELAWAPDALLCNTGLRWRNGGPKRLIVGAGAKDKAVEIALDLDKHGRIAGAYAVDRPRAVKGGFSPTQWRVRFSDFRHHLGRWIPFSGEAGWVIDGTYAVCWECRIHDWRI